MSTLYYWKQSGFSPKLTSDGPVELTRHSTEDQKGAGHVLVAFSGAKQGETCMDWKPVSRTFHYVTELPCAYRVTEKPLVNARFKNWPRDPFVVASYAFPVPKELIRCGPVFERGFGNLHFAGEHACHAIIGYVEGALQSGIRARKRMMVRDGLASSIP